MPLAIQLFFDSRSEAVIRDLWNRFLISGICGYLAQSGSCPHISLSVFDDMPEASAGEVLQAFSERFTAFDLCFSAHGRFPRTDIVFLVPNVTRELLDRQTFIENHLMAGGAKVWSHYAKTSWTPHCTVAMHADLTKARLIQDTLETIALPMPITVQAVGLVRLHPTVHVQRLTLAAS